MRRRTRRGPNTSEATGRIGQEIPSNQPKPLVPTYGDENFAAHRATPAPKQAPIHPIHPEDDFGTLPDDPDEDMGERYDEPAAKPGKLVVETQPESPSIPPQEQETPQVPKGFVVLAIGLPGSGKTTWFKRRGVTPLSSDMLRNILFDDITEQRYQGLVFSTLRSLLRARLIAKMPWNYVDATNLSPHERRQWIKMAKSFGYDVQAVFFDVPVEICIERNSKRERRVSEEILHKMADRLKPPEFLEGFSKITVVRVKGTATE